MGRTERTPRRYGTGGSEPADRTVLLAVLGVGRDTELRDLYEKVKRLARTERGYLRERMEEDNPVPAVRQRFRFPMEPGRQT